VYCNILQQEGQSHLSRGNRANSTPGDFFDCVLDSWKAFHHIHEMSMPQGQENRGQERTNQGIRGRGREKASRAIIMAGIADRMGYTTIQIRLDPMIEGSKYVHTNLIAQDWRSLANFYQKLFGCIPVPPERDLQGEKLEAGAGLPGAHLRGIHLRLPGHGESGPTLEIFSYIPSAERMPAAVNRPGFAHIAFQVADVPAARKDVLAAGGQAVGEIVTIQIADGRKVTWCYVTDPEGNILELQAWDG